MNHTQQVFTKLLAAAAVGKPLPACEEIDWQEFARLAQLQCLQPLLFEACSRLPAEQQPPQALLAQWKQHMKEAVLLDVGQRLQAEQVISAARQKGIPVAMLKGLSVKQLYAKPELRFMSDLDLWVLPADKERMSALLHSLNYKNIGSAEEQNFLNPKGLRIELHTQLYSPEKAPVYSAFFGNLQQTVLRRSDCALKPEEHYIYLLVHYMGHYAAGGAGLRWLLDIWLMENRYTLDRVLLQQWYQELGIEVFSENLYRVILALFAGEAADTLTEEMITYILSAGMFGSRNNQVARAKAGKSHRSYYLGRVFPAAREMKKRYPVLRRAPYLMPFFWIIRIFRALILRKSYIRSELAVVRDTEQVYVDYLQDFHHRTGADAVR